MNISLNALTLDKKLQPRERLDDSLVDEYAEAMKRGDIFPPVRAVANHKTKWLVDGWHREAAARKIGLKEISAQISEGTFEDAEDQSFTVNRDHGLRRTHADVQAAIRRALLTERWVERSDRWIGKHIGCNHATVESDRLRLESTGEIRQLDSLLGEDGKRRPRTIASSGRTISSNFANCEVGFSSHFLVRTATNI